MKKIKVNKNLEIYTLLFKIFKGKNKNQNKKF